MYTAVDCPGGLEYQECGSACPVTCENHAIPPVCLDICVDGCFCPPGQVLLNSTSIICVAVEDCPGMYVAVYHLLYNCYCLQLSPVAECQMHKILDQVYNYIDTYELIYTYMEFAIMQVFR